MVIRIRVRNVESKAVVDSGGAGKRNKIFLGGNIYQAVNYFVHEA